MTELQEISSSRNALQLLHELLYQIRQGESVGGTICSHLIFELESQLSSINHK